MNVQVRVEARMDILGNVVERFNVVVPYYGRKESSRRAELLAHDEKRHDYGIPVHFVAVKTTLANGGNQ